jgi:hypothetical protein
MLLSSTPTVSPNPTWTDTPTPTLSPTHTKTSTFTLTATNSATPTITGTPTTETIRVTALMNAHCRYGPGIAYLHAGDLYTGDTGVLRNRNPNGTWLWVQFEKLSYSCWVAASVVEVNGDIFSVNTIITRLPKSTLYGPVQEVIAVRKGNQVVVKWEEVWMTEDDFRGYMIEAQVCQNGFFIDAAYHTNGTSMTIDDETTCDRESNGKLYAVEKHGYTDPVIVPWP